jgi:small subunit ribosomal protein S8e
MALWQGRSNKKITGGRYRPNRKKLRSEISRELQFSGIGTRRVKQIRTRGNNRKHSVLSDNIANVLDPKTHTSKRSKVITVVENPADPNFVRRNLLTKGAVVETDAGYAKISSRPGQDGILNAVLVDYTPPPSKKKSKRKKK